MFSRARLSVCGIVGRGAPAMAAPNTPRPLLQWPDEPMVPPSGHLPSSFGHLRPRSTLQQGPLDDPAATGAKASLKLKKLQQQHRASPRPFLSRNRPPTRLPHPFHAARNLQPQRQFSPSPEETPSGDTQTGPGRTWLLPIGRYLERSGGASRAAVEWAGNLVAETDRVLLLHCIPQFFSEENPSKDWSEFYRELAKRREAKSRELLQAAERRLRQLAEERHKKISVQHVIGEPTDSPKRAIVSYANDHRVDIIAMGAHETREPSEQLLGGTADYVAQYAKCAVMVCKDLDPEGSGSVHNRFN